MRRARAFGVVIVLSSAGAARGADGDFPFPPPAPRAAESPSALRSAVESLVGTEVHGRAATEWRTRIVRGDDDESDHDVYGRLDLRVGDEDRDRFSAGALFRAAWDPHPRERSSIGRVFTSLDDTFDHEVATYLYTGWAQWRPAGGAVETVRVGRQFVDSVESFHFDGVAAGTRPVDDAMKLRFLGYAGIPVHLFESSPENDFLAGVQATAEPWKDGRATLDLAHAEDGIDRNGRETNDIAGLSLWHRIGPTLLHGGFTWIDEPSDVRVRATTNLDEQDLLVSAGYRRLLEDREQLVTQVDPYFRVLRTLHEYHLADVRAVKGFGDVQIEAGAWVREVANDDDEGPYNRDTRRYWLAPSIEDVPWKGSQLTVGGELWTGDGQRIKTWTADLTHRFSRDLRVSVGSDYALYDYDELRLGERSHVRSAYVRVRSRLTDALSLDARYAWEKDEENTWHVLSVALSVDF